MKIILVFLMLVSFEVAAQTADRIAVISGGGAYGAWGAGICERFHKEGRNYKVVIGTSTGSLMAPFVLLNKYDKLREVYTSVDQRKIFNVSPFRQDGHLRGILFLGCRLAFHKTLGESRNLHKLIRKWYTEADHHSIQNSNKELIVTVANMNDGEPYYMSSNHFAYDSSASKFNNKKRNWNSMVNWIWASANEPVFMSIFKTYEMDTVTWKPLKDKNGKITNKTALWQDGGITQAVSLMEGLKKAVELKIYNVDVIVHGTAGPSVSDFRGTSVLKGLQRTIGILAHSVKQLNIEEGILKEKSMKACDQATQTLTVTIYYMTNEEYNLLPENNELVFNSDKMKQLYQAGLNGKADSITFTVPVPSVTEFIQQQQKMQKQ